MSDEETRKEILLYYRDGRRYNDLHDKEVIRELKDLGYLRCGITPDITETLKTTDNGLIYLGTFDPLPEGAIRVVTGSIVPEVRPSRTRAWFRSHGRGSR